jgi:hypothetical protein
MPRRTFCDGPALGVENKEDIESRLVGDRGIAVSGAGFIARNSPALRELIGRVGAAFRAIAGLGFGAGVVYNHTIFRGWKIK